jgi:hypothetical protein
MMKHPLHDIELIERYFDNELTPSETDQLKDRLKNDFEFQKLFDQEKLLVNTIRVEAAKKDLQFLKEIENSLAGSQRSYIRRHWYYYAAAASISIIVLALWMPWGKENPAELYMAYFQPYPNVFEPTLRGESNLSLRAQAYQAYDQENFQRASEIFSQLVTEKPDAGMLMLLGNSNLILGKTELAKKNFMQLIDQSEDLDAEGKWYLSLCHLKLGDVSAARSLLADIASSENPKKAEASELLEKLL